MTLSIVRPALVVHSEQRYTSRYGIEKWRRARGVSPMSLPTKKVSVWYDEEGDMLEVLWAFREGYFTPTDDDRILKRLDDDGEVIGFLIHEISSLKQPAPLEFELGSESPADDVANVTVREAAVRLGVSERRVRQLAEDGMIRGATKAGAEWLIPTPVEVIPGKRGPVGVAGHAQESPLEHNLKPASRASL